MHACSCCNGLLTPHTSSCCITDTACAAFAAHAGASAHTRSSSGKKNQTKVRMAQEPTAIGAVTDGNDLLRCACPLQRQNRRPSPRLLCVACPAVLNRQRSTSPLHRPSPSLSPARAIAPRAVVLPPSPTVGPLPGGTDAAPFPLSAYGQPGRSRWSSVVLSAACWQRARCVGERENAGSARAVQQAKPGRQ